MLALLVTILTGIWGIRSGIDGVTELGRSRVPSILALNVLEKTLLAQMASNYEAAIWELDYSSQGTFAKISAEKNQAWINADASRKEYERLPMDQESAALWAKFSDEWRAWVDLDNQATTLIDELSANTEPAIQKAIFRRYYDLGGKLQPHYQAARQDLKEVITHNALNVEAKTKQAEHDTSLSKWLMILVGGLASVVLAWLSIELMTSILRQLGGDPAKAVEVAQRIAAGDLSMPVAVRPGDQNSLLAALADMQHRLQDSINRLRGSERRFHSVFANMYEAVALQTLIFDAAGVPQNYRIVEFNDKFQRLLKLPRERLINRLGNEVFGTSEPPYLALYSKVSKTGAAASMDVHIESLDKFFKVSVAPWEADGIATIFADITERKRAEEHLERIAHYDPLTQLPNRVLLADRINQAMALARRNKQLLAVCYLDLDGFKQVNDTHGHEIGDKLLIEVARRLKTGLRASDTVSRLGGDEFVLLLGAFGSVTEIKKIIDGVLTVIAAPWEVQGFRAAVTASIGVTLYPPDDSDPDALIRHADQAMYQAKQSGRSRYCLFDQEHDLQLIEQHRTLAAVRNAMQNNQFCLHFQPKVNMRKHKVIGVEALIRWHHPERGLIYPAEFLPAINGSELEIPLGEWVLAEAMCQLSAWQRAGIHLSIGVNISAKQLEHEDFTTRLERLLDGYPGLPSGSLELEILESTALNDATLISSIIKHFSGLGVAFALDDFGTGYSSLAHLKQLQVDTLKIDQSFIRDMLNDREDLAIVEGVIGLARAFHRKVIAEGVETEAHGRRLLQMDCELAQGYGIARPMPAQELTAWIKGYEMGTAWT